MKAAAWRAGGPWRAINYDRRACPMVESCVEICPQCRRTAMRVESYGPWRDDLASAWRDVQSPGTVVSRFDGATSQPITPWAAAGEDAMLQWAAEMEAEAEVVEDWEEWASLVEAEIQRLEDDRPEASDVGRWWLACRIVLARLRARTARRR